MNIESTRAKGGRTSIAAIALAACFALTVSLAAMPAAAQDGRWQIGVDAVSSTIGDNENAGDVKIDETGSGGGFQVGHLLVPGFMLRLAATSAQHETSDPNVDIRIGGVTFEALFLFREGQAFRPYLFAGLGGYMAESQQQELVFDISGPGATFGAGGHLRLGSRVTLNAGLRVDAINWETARVSYITPTGTVRIEVPIDESGWASKVSLGLGFWL